MRDYEPDTFTENDVLSCLEKAGKDYRNGSRYILSQCPTHEDEHPSVQIYKDDWFVNCHSGCGRYHITKAFPSLRSDGKVGTVLQTPSNRSRSSTDSKDARRMTEHKYAKIDLMEFWESLSEIPEDHMFKGIPISTLHDLGWRYDPIHERYFIPYFSASRTSIPFAQWRNLASGPRFNFWKDAKPTCYGTWNLDTHKLFVCEGASDAAVLEYCGIPWLAMPSAASVELMRKMAAYCKENGIEVVYAGDNDDAGDKLRSALDEVMPYRIKQPPKQYKDWGDFFEAEGYEVVSTYCNEELYGIQKEISEPTEPEPENFLEPVDNNVSILDTVDLLWPDAEKVSDPKRKVRSKSEGSL